MSEARGGTVGKVGIALLKLGVLCIAGWVIASNVSWLDQLELADGEVLSGQIVEGAGPDSESVTLKLEDGHLRSVLRADMGEGGARLGVRFAFERLNAGLYTLGMLMILVMYSLGIWRWKVLLGAQGIGVTYWQAFRLTFIGFFFNNLLIGMTGGDVAKAVLIARDHPGRRSEAVSTVIVDRVIGLAMLAALSAACILWNLEQFREPGYIVFGVLFACVAAFVCFFSRRVRRVLHLNRLLKALPGSAILMKLDRAFQLYRSSPRALLFAFGVSIVAHLFNIGSVYVFGRDLGIEADLATYFATVPIVFIIAAVPLAPAGWGVREVAFISAFMAVGVSPAYKSHILLLSVLLGFSVLAYSLIGGVFLLIGRRSGDLPPQESWEKPA